MSGKNVESKDIHYYTVSWMNPDNTMHSAWMPEHMVKHQIDALKNSNVKEEHIYAHKQSDNERDKFIKKKK